MHDKALLRRLVPTLVLGLSATSPALAASLLVNGGFEAPLQATGTLVVISPGSEPAGFSWTVTAGSVEVMGLPILPFVVYPAYEGSQALDLNGLTNGSLYQDFATVAGQVYELAFVYSDNPYEGGISSAAIAVTDVASSASLLAAAVSHSTASTSADWLSYSATFVATGTSTRLAFTSTSPSTSPSGGVVLDAVTISAVPVPAAAWLLGSSLGLLGWLRRRGDCR